MKKILRVLLSTLLVGLSAVSYAAHAPIESHVLRVQVTHPNGQHGLGSAVMIAEDQVVTNCHVVRDASDVSVMSGSTALPATALKADWKHDICILTVAGLQAPVAELGASKDLKYDSPVIAVGYPEAESHLASSYGTVQGIYPMDGAVIIRASSSFHLGESGGGMFDPAGKLVGIITLKSKGSHAQYFYMPVEWVSQLMQRPATALGLGMQKPFWAESERPFFMQVVQPQLSKDWKQVNSIAQSWVMFEPDNAESWLALATAEFELHQYEAALSHFEKVLSLRQDCSVVQAYLSQLEAQGMLKANSKKLALNSVR
ncbi:MAG: serine protease [Methylophilaceae bacterium]|nr:serine protease [Methylophilaceae bacterium]